MRSSRIKIILFIAVFSIILLLCIGCVSLKERKLKPFESDGCSVFPDGTLEHKDLWLECCCEHDLAYWRGGTYEERKAADRTLRDCIKKVGNPVIAELMLRGVRVGGSPYWPTKFRWGYGWPYPRGYRALSEEEQAAVRAELERADHLCSQK